MTLCVRNFKCGAAIAAALTLAGNTPPVHANADDKIQTRVYLSPDCLISTPRRQELQETGLVAILAPIVLGQAIKGIAGALRNASKEKSETKSGAAEFYLLRAKQDFDGFEYTPEFRCITVVTGEFDAADAESGIAPAPKGGVLGPRAKNDKTMDRLEAAGIIKDPNKSTLASAYEGRLFFADDVSGVRLNSEYLDIQKFYSTRKGDGERGFTINFDLRTASAKTVMFGSVNFGDLKNANKILTKDDFDKSDIKGRTSSLMAVPGATKADEERLAKANAARKNPSDDLRKVLTGRAECEKGVHSGSPTIENAAHTGCFAPMRLVVRVTEVRKKSRVGLFVADLLDAVNETVVSEFSKAIATPEMSVVNAAQEAQLAAKLAAEQAKLAQAELSGDQNRIDTARQAVADAQMELAILRGSIANQNAVGLGLEAVDLPTPEPSTDSENESSHITEVNGASVIVFKMLNPSVNRKGAGPRLIGGEVVDASKWPASVSTQSGRSACTGTVVGPRVLLTAAHCLSGARKATIQGLDGNSFASGTCTPHPNYERSTDQGQLADYAICLMERKIPSNVIPVYESLNTDTSPVEPGKRLLLSGYGCTRPGGGGADGSYRVGEADIYSAEDVLKKLPEPVSSRTKAAIGGFVNLFRGTNRLNGALCSGDSGGPAFQVTYSNTRAYRSVVAVNAQANLNDWSLIAPISSQEFIEFVNNWIESNESPMVCGINTDDADSACRASSL